MKAVVRSASGTWGQSLVNAQCEINRAVSELNRPGRRKGEIGYSPTVDVETVRDYVDQAIAELESVQAELGGRQTELLECPE